MKKSQKINSLAKQYIKTKDQHTLHELIDEFHRKNAYRYAYIAKQELRDGDVHRVQAEFEDTILKTLETFDPTRGKEFEHLLNSSLYRKQIDMWRVTHKEINRRYEKTTFIVDGEETNLLENMKSDYPSPEEIVINKLTKKTINDQKNLITYFKDKNKDPITEEILERIPHHENLNSVAKAMGLQLVQVQRKLAKLKNLYPKDIFGSDYFEYLRV